MNDSTPGAIESRNVLIPRLNPPIVAAVVTDSVLETPEPDFENDPVNFSANPEIERLALALTLTEEPTFDALTVSVRLKPARADAVPLALKSPDEVNAPCTVTPEPRLSIAKEPLNVAPKFPPALARETAAVAENPPIVNPIPEALKAKSPATAVTTVPFGRVIVGQTEFGQSGVCQYIAPAIVVLNTPGTVRVPVKLNPRLSITRATEPTLKPETVAVPVATNDVTPVDLLLSSTKVPSTVTEETTIRA